MPEQIGGAELVARMDALSKRLEVVEEQNEWLEGQLEARDDRIEHLEARIETLETRSELLEAVEAGAANAPAKRAAIILQTLYNKAQASDGYASIDAGGAVDALGGGVDRTLMYSTFDKAEELVGNDDLLYLVKESRASKRNTRLCLDLPEGELPDTVAGMAIKGGAD